MGSVTLDGDGRLPDLASRHAHSYAGLPDVEAVLIASLMLFHGESACLVHLDARKHMLTRLGLQGAAPTPSDDRLLCLLTIDDSDIIATWDPHCNATLARELPDTLILRRPAAQLPGSFAILLASPDRSAAGEAARLGGMDQLWRALDRILLQHQLRGWLRHTVPPDGGRDSLLDAIGTAAGMAALAIDANGDILAVSPAMAELLDASPVALIGRSVFRHLAGEGPGSDRHRILQCFAGGDPWLRDIEVRRSDGGLLEVCCAAQRCREGDESGLLVMAWRQPGDSTPGTDRHPAFHEIITSGRDAVLITDGENLHYPGPQILYANPAFSRMTGYPPEASIGRSPHMLQGARTDRAALVAFIRMLEENLTARTELINYTREGIEFRIEIEARGVPDPVSGRRQFVATQRDVTQRHQARRNHDELEVALAHVGDGVILCDRLDRISWCNPAARAMLEGEPCIDRSLPEVLVDTGELLALHSALQQVRASGQAQALEVVGARQRRPLRLRLAPLPGAGRQPLRVVVTIQDLAEFRTARRQVELQSRVMEAVPGPLAMADRHGHVIWLNEAMQALLGNRHAVGEYLPDLLPHECDHVRHRIRSAMIMQSTWRGDIGWPRPDEGRVRIHAHSIRPLHTGDHAAGPAFLFIGEDITARRDYAHLRELRNRRLESLVNLHELALGSTRPEGLALEAVERMRAGLMVEQASLLLFNGTRLETVATATLGKVNRDELPVPTAWLAERIRYAPDRSCVAMCYLADDGGGRAGSIVAIAPLGGRARYRGAIVISDEAGRILTDADLLYQRAVGDIVDGALDAEKERGRTEHLIHNDPLTNLPNRRSFLEHLQFMIDVVAEQQAALTLLVLDLNRFRQINNSFGHDAGDELLRMLATRLAQAAPDNAIIARLGADEFGMLLPFSRRNMAEAVALRVHRQVNKPLTVGEDTLHPRVSVGIAGYPADGDRADDLLLAANSARLEAKRLQQPTASSNRSGPDFTREDVRIEHRLHEAIDSGQLDIHFQPIRRLDNGELRDLEALVRWDDPVLGTLPPSRFIPVAENAGMIALLDRHMIARAVDETDRFGVNVSVNVSVQTLLDDAFCGFVRGVLGRSSRPAGSLTLEITERVFADSRHVRPVLDELVGLGVRIAVDDFGTGYSSLHLLPELPVHRLKIDGSFLARRNDRPGYAAVILATARLARGIGMHSLIEGVESQGDLNWVRATGIDYGQGYFLGRPSPLDDLLARQGADPGSGWRS